MKWKAALMLSSLLLAWLLWSYVVAFAGVFFIGLIVGYLARGKDNEHSNRGTKNSV